jgi:hypothetical protein
MRSWRGRACLPPTLEIDVTTTRIDEPRLQPRRAALRLITALVALALAAVVAPSARSAEAGPPGAVPAASATAAELAARVTWTAAPAGAAPIEDYVLEARDASGKYAGRHIACATCTAFDFEGLAANQPYTFTVRARNRYGTAPERVTGVVRPTSALCGAAVSCSSVDATTDKGPNRLRAQGLLHGISAWTPRALLDPLHVQSWRISSRDMEHDTEIATHETIVLSDLWGSYTYGWLQIYGSAPWMNWNLYRTFIAQTVQRYKDQGRTGLTWDIQNEPDISEHYDWYKTANASLILEQFATAYGVIKSVDPTARIVGPSLSFFTATPGTRLMDLRTFLDFAAARNMKFAAISWHESGGAPDDVSYDNRPASVVRHVQEVRALIAARPSLGNPEIHINEYSPEATRRIPGWSVGYIEAMERANVDQANLACFWALDQGPGFSTCDRGVMDDLIRTDGTPHAAYWVHRAYAEMQGGRRLATGSTDPNITAFATTNGATVQALVGRSQGCTFSRAFACPAAPAAPVSHEVALRLPSGTNATVTLERIANVPATSPGLEPVSTQVLPVVGGVVRIPIPSFADGDAYRVKVTPDDAAAPEPSPTTTTLSSSAPVAVTGQPVTLTALVTVVGPPNAAGMVEFKRGTTSLGTAPVGADRNARLTIPSLPVGTHSLTAQYSGGLGLQPSTSPPLSQRIDKAAVTMLLQQASPQATGGQAVLLRTTVTTAAPGRGTPTGTVTYRDGSTLLGTAPLVAGVADLTKPLSAGNHWITATYDGDPGRQAMTVGINVYQWYMVPWVW